MRYQQGMVTILAIFTLLTGLGSYAKVPIVGGDLVFATAFPVQTLDPHLALDNSSIQVSKAIYQTLVKYSTEDETIQPCLASSWQANKQGKEWIFHLREGIRFHDGAPFNADAVIFSFERQLNPNHPYYEEKCFYGRYLFGRIIDKLQAVDEYTVKFTLKSTYVPFLYSLVSPAAMIVSPKAVKEYGKNFYQHPAGTGPFKLLDWGEDGEVVLERYEDSWGEKAHLNSLVFRPIPQEDFMIQALRKRKIQGAEFESSAGIKLAAESANQLKLVEIPHLEVVYLALNMRKTPLNRLKIREALYRAIDKEKLQRMFYPEKAVIARSLIPPTLWGYNPDLSEYELNPKRSRQLLKEAKVEGLTINLWIPEIPTSHLPDPEGMAGQIKEDLAKVGINVQIVKMDWRSYLKGCEKGEHHMTLSGWKADFPDPYDFLYPLLDPQVLRESDNTNWSFYQSSFLHEILQRARQISDRIERKRLYQVAQKIIKQDIPCIPLVHTRQTLAFSPEVEGISIDYAGAVEFNKMWISKK